jgi:hypothetical protein
LLLMDGILAPALTLPPAVLDCNSTRWERLVRMREQKFLWHLARCGKFVYVQLHGRSLDAFRVLPVEH